MYMAVQAAKAVVNEVSKPGHLLAENFIQKLAAGDVKGAADVTAPEVSRNDIQSISQQIQQLGTFRDLQVTNVAPAQVNGIWQVTLSGTARFTKGSKRFSITVAKEPQGVRVIRYTFE
jgi:hypothetical protein